MSHLHDVVTDVKIPLPEGVLNIDMDERMYEYSADVFDYLMSREDELSVPEDFLKNGGVTEKMRNTLVDWIIQVGSTVLQYNSVYFLLPFRNLIVLSEGAALHAAVPGDAVPRSCHPGHGPSQAGCGS